MFREASQRGASGLSVGAGGAGRVGSAGRAQPDEPAGAARGRSPVGTRTARRQSVVGVGGMVEGMVERKEVKGGLANDEARLAPAGSGKLQGRSGVPRLGGCQFGGQRQMQCKRPRLHDSEDRVCQRWS